jgi:acyl-coenzyme A thioesterase PaaI-like protein
MSCRDLSPRRGIVAADVLGSMSGLDVLQRIADGRFPPPPIAELLGFRPVVIENGRAVFVATPDARLYNPIGSVHGGYAATLLDFLHGLRASPLPGRAQRMLAEIRVSKPD